MKNIIIYITLTLFLTACSNTAKERTQLKNLNNKDYQQPKITKPITQAYIETTDGKDIILDSKISINVKNASLIDAITKEKPSINVVALDEGVHLDKKVFIRANKIKFSDYLEQLGRISGYSLVFKDGKVLIASRITKTWNLASLASLPESKSSISSQSTAKNTQNNNSINLLGNQEWLDVVNNIGLLVNDTKKNPAKILTNRRLGTISVIASPGDIYQVDQYLQKIITDSNKQVALEITVFDVVLNESISSGLDFNILLDGVNGALGINNSVANAVSTFKLGTLDNNKPLLKGDVKISAVLNLLNQYGKAKVISKPIITLTNGMSSQFGGVNSIRFVSNITANTDQSGNVIQTSELEDMEVGLQMSVSVRLVDDKRILVQLVPSVSSVVSYTEVTTNQQSFQLPNVSLQSLLTQVIVNDRQSIVVGGLVSNRVVDDIKSVDSSLFSFLDGKRFEKEHREIFFLVKATILN